jgi:uncharacterized protein YbjT (DUF2867 family)
MPPASPVVAIPAASGAQSRAIAAAFEGAGWTVRGTRRDPAAAFPADLETGEGLARAFEGADAVVLTLPQDHRAGAQERIAEAVAREAARAGAARIVFNVAGRIAEGSDAEIFRSLRAARAAVTEGDVPSVVLQPTVYMDNLLAPWSLPAIAGGTLAYPANPAARVAWISHATLAEAVVAAATRDVVGEDVAIGGPEAMAGPDLAAALAAHLGRPVAYAPIPLDAFAAGLDAAMGAPAGDRIAELYAHLADHPEAMADGAAGLARLGVTPEPFAAFVARSRWS